MITAGIGCRQGCPAPAILALLHQAATQAAVTIDALAAPYFKRHEPGLLEAAAHLALPLHFIPEPALLAAQPHCLTRSARTQAATGHPSIAEACAIAHRNGRLILPRIANPQATCALATCALAITEPSP